MIDAAGTSILVEMPGEQRSTKIGLRHFGEGAPISGFGFVRLEKRLHCGLCCSSAAISMLKKRRHNTCISATESRAILAESFPPVLFWVINKFDPIWQLPPSAPYHFGMNRSSADAALAINVGFSAARRPSYCFPLLPYLRGA